MQSFDPVLIIRADADSILGSGHVMRCLAIAQSWLRTGGNVHYVCRDLPDPMEDRLVKAGCVVHRIESPPGSQADAEGLGEIARELAADWVVVDGYAFNIDFQQRALASVQRLLMVRDDAEPTKAAASVILNSNTFAQRDFYSAEFASEFLIGPSYALLRDEFREAARNRMQSASQVRRVLITFGGADPNDMTSRALAALCKLNDRALHVDVVLSSYSTRQSLPIGPMPSQMQVRYRQNVANMASLMSRADIALTAGGTTCFELAAVGVPMLIVAIAGNQIPVATTLGDIGAAVFLGEQANLLDAELAKDIEEIFDNLDRRRSIAETARRLVDGRGTARVVDRMLRPLMRMRSARAEDARCLFDWQQDSEVRRWSFTKGPSDLSEHCHWLTRKLADENSEILLCESNSGAAIGCLRLDRNFERATIGLLLGAEFRGRGLATAVLGAALDHLAARNLGLEIDAFIKPENEASRRTFSAAGFSFRALERLDGQPAERWTLNSFGPTGAEFPKDLDAAKPRPSMARRLPPQCAAG